MKLTAIEEDDENIVVVPLCWLTRQRRMELIRDGYEVIPILGYRETAGLRAYKIIGPLLKLEWWTRDLSISIWEDWKLTAHYVTKAERPMSTSGQQMFDLLDDDEKIQAFTYSWYSITSYIIKYFREHPELLERARHSLKLEEINKKFKDLFI